MTLPSMNQNAGLLSWTSNGSSGFQTSFPLKSEAGLACKMYCILSLYPHKQYIELKYCQNTSAKHISRAYLSVNLTTTGWLYSHHPAEERGLRQRNRACLRLFSQFMGGVWSEPGTSQCEALSFQSRGMCSQRLARACLTSPCVY